MAKVKEVRADYGMSFNVNETWHRVSFGVTIEVEGNDDVAEIKKKAWATCEVEIEKQVQDIVKTFSK